MSFLLLGLWRNIPVPERLVQMDTGYTRGVWSCGLRGKVWKLRRNRRSWRLIPGLRLAHVSAGEAGVWGIGKNNQVYFRKGK